jgi:hypothetical protein
MLGACFISGLDLQTVLAGSVEAKKLFGGITKRSDADGAYLGITPPSILNDQGHGRRQTSVANLDKCNLRQRPSHRTSTYAHYDEDSARASAA